MSARNKTKGRTEVKARIVYGDIRARFQRLEEKLAAAYNRSAGRVVLELQSNGVPENLYRASQDHPAFVLLKFPGNDSLAGMYVSRAVQLDTLEANKITYLKNIATYYEQQKKFKEPIKNDFRIHNVMLL